MIDGNPIGPHPSAGHCCDEVATDVLVRIDTAEAMLARFELGDAGPYGGRDADLVAMAPWAAAAVLEPGRRRLAAELGVS